MCILIIVIYCRDDARAIFVSYLTHYSPGKRLDKYVQFFVTQLNYELQHGRESSLKFLDNMIINKLNVAQLKIHGDFLFLSLGACMINDSAPECREAAANCIEAMLKKFPLLERNKLFDLVLAFFKDTQPVHFELAAQLSIRFVNVEQEEFTNRLNSILSLVSGKILLLNNDIAEGRFVKIKLDHGEKTDEEKQKEKDHSLIQILNLIDKITIHCSDTLKNKKFVSDYDELAQQCQALLAYPHAWVRLRAAKILGTVLSHVDIEELNTKEKDSDRGFIYYDTENSLRSLILDLCAQYTPNVSKDMAEQVTAVLFQILKLVHAMPCFALSKKVQTEDRDEDRNAKVNIRWILFKQRKAINVEVAKAPNSMHIRTAIFTMWLHVMSSLETDDINRIVDVILPAIVRELSTGDGPSSAAKQLAGRLGKKLRRKIGEIEYSKMAAEVQTKLNIKRSERKKILLQEKVNNPEKAAKRKLQLREKKKQAKKIKLEMMHGKRPRAKKRKAEDIDFEGDLFKDTEE